MYQIPKLKKYKNLFHAFSTVEDGNMSFKFEEEDVIRKKRKAFLKKCSIDPQKVASAYLVHETTVETVKDEWWGDSLLYWDKAPRIDGLLTNKKGHFVSLLVADCLPIILFDTKTRALGIVHAGWKGVENKIVQTALDKMNKEYGTHMSDLVVAIGPHIQSDSYRFEEVVQKEKDRFPLWKKYLTDNSDGTTSIDLTSFTKDQLIEKGVLSENIIVSDVDTGKDTEFFSHYRDTREKHGDRGRFMCVVGIR